jgi:hypothetical protein
MSVQFIKKNLNEKRALIYRVSWDYVIVTGGVMSTWVLFLVVSEPWVFEM